MMDISQIIDVGSKVIAAASALTAMTPTTKDDTVLAWIKKALNFLALNFAHATVASANDVNYNK